MMTVTFLDHSGFLAELPSAALLFDWWRGELPPLPAKPLLVFASHRHPDHFTPGIFALDDGRREIRFLLGRALLGVKLDDLVHQSQLLILEFISDILLYNLRIFPYKLNV